MDPHLGVNVEGVDVLDLLAMGLVGYGVLNRNPDDGIVAVFHCPACHGEHDFRTHYENGQQDFVIQFDWQCKGRAYKTANMGFDAPITKDAKVPFFSSTRNRRRVSRLN